MACSSYYYDCNSTCWAGVGSCTCNDNCTTSCGYCAYSCIGGGCNNACDTSCSGSCSGCSGYCSGGCYGCYGCSGCGAACTDDCTYGCYGCSGCGSACSYGCTYGCTLTCTDACNYGCRIQANTPAYNALASLQTLIKSSDAVNLRNLIAEEAARWGQTNTVTSMEDVGQQIKVTTTMTNMRTTLAALGKTVTAPTVGTIAYKTKMQEYITAARQKYDQQRQKA